MNFSIKLLYVFAQEQLTAAFVHYPELVLNGSNLTHLGQVIFFLLCFDMSFGKVFNIFEWREMNPIFHDTMKYVDSYLSVGLC